MGLLHRTKRDEGFTLMELMMAVAIFSIVLGATAQALVSYYATLDVQNRRNTALRHCSTVLSQMREARTTVATFPSGLVSLYPNNGNVAGVVSLPQETVRVT